ncbi:MAG: hypothetical protein FWC93_07505 [Defluviitaleaceae bacterium]|nr:hypothetical protein [Defluviitaleaceae bacterium]
MATTAIDGVLFLVFLFAIFVGTVVLQIYLSRKDSKWLGLLLPLITFGFSLIAVIGMAAYVEIGPLTMSQFIDGELVTTIISGSGSREAIPGAIAGVFYTFLLMNIPTAILLVIYRATRSKRNRLREVEKMSLQDLE